MKTANLHAVETQGQKTRHSPLDRMDAIACGVHARFEESTGYSRKITETTVNIARALGVPEREINQWAANRSHQLASEAARLGEIKPILEKYYGNSPGATV